MEFMCIKMFGLQWLVVRQDPSLLISVEFVFVAIIVNRDELVVELGERYAVIAIEFARVCREYGLHFDNAPSVKGVEYGVETRRAEKLRRVLMS